MNPTQAPWWFVGLMGLVTAWMAYQQNRKKDKESNETARENSFLTAQGQFQERLMRDGESWRGAYERVAGELEETEERLNETRGLLTAAEARERILQDRYQQALRQLDLFIEKREAEMPPGESYDGGGDCV